MRGREEGKIWRMLEWRRGNNIGGEERLEGWGGRMEEEGRKKWENREK